MGGQEEKRGVSDAASSFSFIFTETYAYLETLVGVRRRGTKEACMARILHNLLGRKGTIVHTKALELRIQVLGVDLMCGAADEEARRQRLLRGQIGEVLARTQHFTIAVRGGGGTGAIVGQSYGVPF